MCLIFLRVGFDLRVARNEVFFTLPPSENLPLNTSIKLAVISDLHIQLEKNRLYSFDSLLSQVSKSAPDLILLLGDYVGDRDSNSISRHQRSSIADQLGALVEVAPVFAILGNHEHWDSSYEWTNLLQLQGISVLENSVERFQTNGVGFCIRGIADAFVGADRETPMPQDCKGMVRVTITHDPFAAFSHGLGGIVFAGHTHCGQVQFPLLGPLWAPTLAPRNAWCGLYKEDDLTLWTSSGVGTSVLPIRFLAKSSWDLVSLSTSGSSIL